MAHRIPCQDGTAYQVSVQKNSGTFRTSIPVDVGREMFGDVDRATVVIRDATETEFRVQRFEDFVEQVDL